MRALLLLFPPIARNRRCRLRCRFLTFPAICFIGHDECYMDYYSMHHAISCWHLFATPASACRSMRAATHSGTQRTCTRSCDAADTYALELRSTAADSSNRGRSPACRLAEQIVAGIEMFEIETKEINENGRGERRGRGGTEGKCRWNE